MREIDKKYIYIMMFFAYIFSIAVRYLWVYQHGSNPEFLYNGSYIINTNDGYYFASGVQKALYGLHQFNPLVPGIFERGLVFFTLILAKILPFSLETIMFYLPSITSSIIVFPMMLIANLYKKPWWGFFSALIASIAWSYYNRTMIGYYDTDMFAIMLLMWLFYYLLKSIPEQNLKSVLIASIFLIVFPFFYKASRLVIYATLIFYALYILYESKISTTSLKKLTILFIAAAPLPLESPYNMLLSLIIVVALYFMLIKRECKRKNLVTITVISFLLLLYFGDIFLAIYSKVQTYTHTGVDNYGLKFFGVFQTIAEASGIPFFADGQANSVANRTIGSSIAFVIAVIGYLYLIYKRKEFLIALPLVGIGIFAHWGGLRFTIYGVPFFAFAFVYLFEELTKFITKEKLVQISIVALATIAVLYTNIYHAWAYNKAITPVFIKSEIKQLEKLKQLSNPKDFTLSWWDYGYPIWFYTDTNTLIDGSKHRHDNFIISKILISQSSNLAYNLAVKSVEEYAKATNSYKEWKKNGADKNNIPKEYDFVNRDGKHYNTSKPFDPVINILLRDNQPDQKDPNEFLAKLNSDNYPLPPKTRDIYLYMPIKSVNIFPAIVEFSNLDLTTGKPLRRVIFMPTYIYKYNKGIFSLIYRGSKIGDFDTKTGLLKQNSGDIPVSKLIVAQTNKKGDIKLNAFKFNNNSNLTMLFLKSTGQMILLDNQTLNSNYVKMFLLGLYDKDKFELVDKSPYGRVYKLKR